MGWRWEAADVELSFPIPPGLLELVCASLSLPFFSLSPSLLSLLPPSLPPSLYPSLPPSRPPSFPPSLPAFIPSLPLSLPHSPLLPPSSYRFQTIFLKVVHKLHKEHISTTATPAEAQPVSELLQLCLELVKGRVTGMPQEARKGFFTILTSLIEKSTV